MDIKCTTGRTYNFTISLPDTCPRCGRDLSATPLSVIYLKSEKAVEQYAVTVSCQQCNQAIFFDVMHLQTALYGTLTGTYPAPQLSNLPAGMDSLYPDFVKVYCQAVTAEARGLTDICGMGYRKALEILVKQYSIKAFPSESDAIQTEFLAKTVSRIQNSKIQSLAKAATWLGNDQTHLQALHPEYSVSDIKSFIRALCYHILMEEEVSRAQELINKPHQ